MGRYGIPIYKWDTDGNLVTQYSGLKWAIATEHVDQVRLYAAMDHGTLLRGHYWTRTPEKPVIIDGVISCPVDSLDTLKRHLGEPWEGEDGMFDIDGWGRAVRERDFHVNLKATVVQKEVSMPKRAFYHRRRA